MSSADPTTPATPKGRPTKTRAFEVLERRRKAVQLRASRIPWHEIAHQLGYSSAAAACKDVSRWYELERNAGRAELDARREEELAALDLLQARLMTRALGGELQVVDRVVRLSERRSKLLGLDAPLGVHVETPAEVTDSIRAIAAALAGEAPDPGDDEEVDGDG